MHSHKDQVFRGKVPFKFALSDVHRLEDITQARNPECMICLGDAMNPASEVVMIHSGSCKNAFCLDCLQNWVAQAQDSSTDTFLASTTCPACRQALIPSLSSFQYQILKSLDFSFHSIVEDFNIIQDFVKIASFCCGGDPFIRLLLRDPVWSRSMDPYFQRVIVLNHQHMDHVLFGELMPEVTTLLYSEVRNIYRTGMAQIQDQDATLEEMDFADDVLDDILEACQRFVTIEMKVLKAKAKDLSKRLHKRTSKAIAELKGCIDDDAGIELAIQTFLQAVISINNDAMRELTEAVEGFKADLTARGRI